MAKAPQRTSLLPGEKEIRSSHGHLIFIEDGEKIEGTAYLTDKRFIFESQSEGMASKLFHGSVKEKVEEQRNLDLMLSDIVDVSKSESESIEGSILIRDAFNEIGFQPSTDVMDWLRDLHSQISRSRPLLLEPYRPVPPPPLTAERACSRCGARLKTNEKYCHSCGEPIKTKTPSATKEVEVPSLEEAKEGPPLVELGRNMWKRAEKGFDWAGRQLVDISSKSREKASDLGRRMKTNLLRGSVLCSKCGSSVKLEDKFCPNCGVEIVHKRCTRCGYIAPPKDKFCRNCGAEIVK